MSARGVLPQRLSAQQDYKSLIGTLRLLARSRFNGEWKQNGRPPAASALPRLRKYFIRFGLARAIVLPICCQV